MKKKRPFESITVLFFFGLLLLPTLLLAEDIGTTQSSTNKVRVLAAKSQADASHSYFVELLSLALVNNKSHSDTSEVQLVQAENVDHESVVRLLKDGYIDVMWAGSSSDSAQHLQPIQFPIIKGLLGYRLSIIHKDNLAAFKAKGLYAYEGEVACQVAYWPDTKILIDNGYNVRKVTAFSQTFQLLNRKRCTYFPRAIFEGHAELAAIANRYPDLAVFDDVILQYPLPYFFYVNKNNTKLESQLKSGLSQALKNGSYDKLMRRHELTKHLFPLKQWKSKMFIPLENTDLPASYAPPAGSLIQLH